MRFQTAIEAETFLRDIIESDTLHVWDMKTINNALAKIDEPIYPELKAAILDYLIPSTMRWVQ